MAGRHSASGKARHAMTEMPLEAGEACPPLGEISLAGRHCSPTSKAAPPHHTPSANWSPGATETLTARQHEAA